SSKAAKQQSSKAAKQRCSDVVMEEGAMVVAIGRCGQRWYCRCSKTRSFCRTGATSTPAGSKNLLLCRSEPGREAVHAFHPLLKLASHPASRIPHHKESFTVRNGLSLASLSFRFW
ncbi:hypothetical protein LN536_02170, partial [Xanthomonas vesicatoria]|nr:hypothetical protein [Xanthomonas vesicatoria]